jgi:HlyD family secretion protein
VTDIETEAGTDTGTETARLPATAPEAATVSVPERAELSERLGGTHRRRVGRKSIATITILILLAAGGGAVAAERGRIWPAHAATGDSGVQDNTSAASIVTVKRQDLTSQTQINGSLGYTGTYTVVGGAHGTVTALPAIGQAIKQGQTIYQVDGAPVILLYGSVPM